MDKRARPHNGQCEFSSHCRSNLCALLIGGKWAEYSTEDDTMQRSLKLASQASSKIAGEPSLSHWGLAAQAAMTLVVIVLLALTFAGLEIFLSGDESLSAIEAAMAIGTHEMKTLVAAIALLCLSSTVLAHDRTDIYAVMDRTVSQ
jgi:ABC-type uncharacterized transport system permease subunit